jgi:hypothetical protein
MPMSTLERDSLAKSFAVCKTLLYDLQPKLAQLAELYDAAGGVKTTLEQAELDEETALSGLTKQQMDDGMYVLTTILLPGIVQGYPSLAQLAARFL